MRLRGLYLIGFAAAASAGGVAQSLAAEFCVACDGPPAQYTCQFDDTVANVDDSRLRLTCITELARAGGHAACSVDRTRTPPCGGEVRHMALPDGGGPLIPGVGPGVGGPGVGGPGIAGGGPGETPETPAAAPGVAPPPGGAAGTAAQGGGAAPGATLGTTTPQPPAAEAPPGDAAETDAAQEADKGPPHTVQEMVEQSAKSTSKALKKTGEAATDAAEKTGSALQNAGKAVGGAAKKTWNCITSLFGDC